MESSKYFINPNTGVKKQTYTEAFLTTHLTIFIDNPNPLEFSINPPSRLKIEEVINFLNKQFIYRNNNESYINLLLRNDDANSTIQRALIELHLDCILRKSW